MATRTWNSSGNTDCNDGSNYSPTGAIQTTDDLIFDGTSTVNCSLTANLEVNSITWTSGYTGTWDADTYDLTIGDGGVVGTGKVTNPIRLGSGSHECSGDWIFYYSTDYAYILYEDSTVTLTGTSKTVAFGGRQNDYVNNVIISGSYSTVVNTAGSGGVFAGSITVSGSLTNNSNNATDARKLIMEGFDATGNLKITSTGNVSGNKIYFRSLQNANSGIMQLDGTLTADIDLLFRVPNSNGHFVPGVYGGDVVFATDNGAVNPDVRFQSGNYIFQGDVVVTNVNTAHVIMNASANNPNITFQGSLTFAQADDTWVAGTGTITFSAPNAQTNNVDFNDQTVEDLVIGESGRDGTIELTDGVTTDSVTVAYGTFDINGQALETDPGNFTVNAGASVIE